MAYKDERGAVSMAVVYAVAAVVILAIGIAIFVAKNKSGTPETPTPTSPLVTEPTHPPPPAGQGAAGSTSPSVPTGDPRLAGAWQLVFRVKSSSVSSINGKSYSLAYAMQPRCSSGACDTVVKSSPAITLKQNGSNYKGSVDTSNTATCSGSPGSSKASLTLKVTHSDASASGEEAKKLAGSAKQSGPAQGGCSSFSVTYDVTGTPTGGSGSKSALPLVSQTRPPATGGGGGGTTSGGGGGNTGQSGTGQSGTGQ